VPGSHKYNLVCPEAEMVDVETSVIVWTQTAEGYGAGANGDGAGRMRGSFMGYGAWIAAESDGGLDGRRRSDLFILFRRRVWRLRGSILPAVGMVGGSGGEGGGGERSLWGGVAGERTALINDAEIVWIDVYRIQS